MIEIAPFKNMLYSTNLLFDLFYVMAHSPTVDHNDGSGTAAIKQYSEDGSYVWNLVRFVGTDLDSDDGVIKTISYAQRDNGGQAEYQFRIGGLHISSADFLSGIELADDGDTSGLKAIFKGFDWSYTAGPGRSETFEGTGGDDEASLGNDGDYLNLDGGNDKIDMGRGDDSVFNFNSFGYAARGLSRIDGGRGEDNLYLSALHGWTPKSGLKIDLNGTIDLGRFQIRAKNFEDVTGTVYADTITGTDADNWLIGGGGGDIITGGRGVDRMAGYEGGKDTFLYHDVHDSGTGTARDVITDFQHGEDVIDLSFIDPGTNNHRFHFVGSAPLKDIGDLHLIVHNPPKTAFDYTLVQVNLDDDRGAEFEIQVDYSVDLTKEDFRL
jgi:Ca2+-binding RTX toxin-like protein